MRFAFAPFAVFTRFFERDTPHPARLMWPVELGFGAFFGLPPTIHVKNTSRPPTFLCYSPRVVSTIA
jgi:hypothetical protein